MFSQGEAKEEVEVEVQAGAVQEAPSGDMARSIAMDRIEMPVVAGEIVGALTIVAMMHDHMIIAVTKITEGHHQNLIPINRITLSLNLISKSSANHPPVQLIDINGEDHRVLVNHIDSNL